jgi:hypothetical protein
MVVDVFREADGRLQGVLETPDGRRDPFVSTLDLLRVLEGLELTSDPGAQPEHRRGRGSSAEVDHG